MKDLSIIIVNYNVLSLLQLCLDSLEHWVRGISYEIIVVDNASNDGSAQVLSQDRRLTYVYLEENVGFGRANNRGLELATGRNILFLNPDTGLLHDAPSVLCHYLDTHPEVGACGANLLTPQLTPNQSFMRYRPGLMWELHQLSWNLWFRLRGDRNLFFNHGTRPLSVGYITGAALCVRRSVLDQVGAFDADFFLYFEETDLCYRIALAGYALHNVPQARIIHLEGGSVASAQKVERMRQSRKIYQRKHFGAFRCLVIDILHAVWYGVHRLRHRNDKMPNP